MMNDEAGRRVARRMRRLALLSAVPIAVVALALFAFGLIAPAKGLLVVAVAVYLTAVLVSATAPWVDKLINKGL